MSLLLMIMRVAFVERMIAAAKGAGRRSLRAGYLTACAAIAAFFAISLLIVVGVMALSEVMSPLLATAAFAALFLVIAGVLAIFAARALEQVRLPATLAPKPEAKPGIALSPPVMEALIAGGVAVILGVIAGRARQGRKSSE